MTDDEHERVSAVLENLESLRGKVIVGFCVLGFLYALLWIGAFVYFFW